MCEYWIGFIVYLLLIIGGIYALKLPKLLGIRYLIFSLFIDAFYISIPYQNIACQFIFGGLTLLTIFVNLSVNFVQSDKNKFIKRFELVFDFVLGIGLSIYLIYIIPNQDLQNIIIPIISAVYGGLLTLVGVAWTIRKSDSDRKQEEKNKVKPYLKNYLNSYLLDQDVKIDFVDLNKQENFKCQGFVLYIHNISQSIVFITDIIINNTYYPLNNVVLEKNGKIQLHVKYYNQEIDVLKNISIVGKDVLNNYYAFDMHSDNLCERFEDTAIELPREIEYKKVK